MSTSFERTTFLLWKTFLQRMICPSLSEHEGCALDVATDRYPGQSWADGLQLYATQSGASTALALQDVACSAT